MKKIPLSDIDLGEEEINNVMKVLKSKWLSMGPVTQKFEDNFANYLGIKHAFGVSNGTAALHLANKVLGIGPGDEVIMPSLTFVATANSTLYCGAKPVFADITSLDNLNISPEDILEKITNKTKAITVVHYAGFSCDMDAIMEIAEDYNLTVIEDVAHAPGAMYKGEKCGTIGNIGCFSFFANKNIVTGEGGMIVTNDQEVAEKIRTMRSHSMTTLTWDRHLGHAYSYDVVDLGYNYRLNEIASSIGVAQLKNLDKNNLKREKIFKKYIRVLKGVADFQIPFKDFKGTYSYHIFPLILSGNITQSEFILKLSENDIQTSIHYPPVHLFTHYKNVFKYKEGFLPKTEYVGENEVTLPLYPSMSKNDFEIVIDAIKNLL